jgi:hypothetical protein
MAPRAFAAIRGQAALADARSKATARKVAPLTVKKIVKMCQLTALRDFPRGSSVLALIFPR